MKKEQIVDFTRRISQANRSGLVVVMYDIFFTYLDDARAAYDAADWDAYKEALRRAQRAIDELISALNFSYDMAKNLYSIYVFCRDSIAKSLYKRDLADAEDACRLMKKLYDGFLHAAGQDHSEPLMKNTDVTIWWRLVRIPIVPEDFWYKNPLDFFVCAAHSCGCL